MVSFLWMIQQPCFFLSLLGTKMSWLLAHFTKKCFRVRNHFGWVKVYRMTVCFFTHCRSFLKRGQQFSSRTFTHLVQIELDVHGKLCYFRLKIDQPRKDYLLLVNTKVAYFLKSAQWIVLALPCAWKKNRKLNCVSKYIAPGPKNITTKTTVS